MLQTYVPNASKYIFMCFVLCTTMTMLRYYFVTASTNIEVCSPMAQYHIQEAVLDFPQKRRKEAALYVTCLSRKHNMLPKT
jgi:hypothetical protein